MHEQVLAEQISYYDARAQEYDASVSNAEIEPEAVVRAHALLRQMGLYEQVLELACGTGLWTGTLLAIGREINVLDASNEMLVLTRQKHGDDRVQYRQVDLFQWEPEEAYDLVFFAYWLSHVPPAHLAPFLQKVRRAVKPGGSVVVIDQYAPTEEDRQLSKAGEAGEIYADRMLQDGRHFTIVKVFYSPDTLHETFASQGFNVKVQPLDNSHFFLSGH